MNLLNAPKKEFKESRIQEIKKFCGGGRAATSAD
jgi:hypothetical protein